MKRILTLFVAIATLGLAACGGGDTEAPVADRAAEQATDPAAEQEAATPPTGGSTAEVTSENGVATVTLTPVGNEMRYEQTEFTVEAGQQVRIVLNNTATSPAMSHNVVILTDADAVNRVGQAAIAAAANDYIPEDEAIYAYTPMAAPGETVEVTFEAPSEPGDYRYICTFPGHYVTMQGTMRVTAAAGA